MKKLMLFGLLFIVMISFAYADVCDWSNDPNYISIFDNFNRADNSNLEMSGSGHNWNEGAGDSIVSNQWSMDASGAGTYISDTILDNSVTNGITMQFNASLDSSGSGFQWGFSAGEAAELFDYDNRAAGKIKICNDVTTTNSFNGDYVIKVKWGNGATNVSVYNTDGSLVETIVDSSGCFNQPRMSQLYAFSSGNEIDDLMIWNSSLGECTDGVVYENLAENKSIAVHYGNILDTWGNRMHTFTDGVVTNTFANTPPFSPYATTGDSDFSGAHPTSIVFDLNNSYNIDFIKVVGYSEFGYIDRYNLNYSLDNVSWTSIGSNLVLGGYVSDWTPVDIDARFIRFEGVSLANNGGDTYGGLTEIEIWGSTSPPTGISLVSPTPADNSKNNTFSGVFINVTSDADDIAFYWNGTLVGNGSETSPFIFELNATLVPHEGDYTYNATNGVENTATRTWTYDTTSPDITLNNNINGSVNYKDVNNVTLNFTLTDNVDMFGFQINITDSSDNIIYLETNTTLSGASVDINRIIDISNNASGQYDVNIIAEDSHTANYIKDYQINKKNKKLEFNTAEGNYIEIETNMDADPYTTRKYDRYKFGFKYKEGLFPLSKNKKFYVKCDGDLTYRPNSEYQGHFVCWNGQNGNWIDFEGEGEVKSVKKVKQYWLFGDEYYEVVIESDKNDLEFNSIGGLNINEIDFSYNVSSINVTSLRIDPPVLAVSLTDLDGYCTATEGLSKDVSYEFFWYKNGEQFVHGIDTSNMDRPYSFSFPVGISEQKQLPDISQAGTDIEFSNGVLADKRDIIVSGGGIINTNTFEDCFSQTYTTGTVSVLGQDDVYLCVNLTDTFYTLWYVNDTVYANEYNYSTINEDKYTSGSETLLSTIDSSDTTVGDNWTFSCAGIVNPQTPFQNSTVEIVSYGIDNCSSFGNETLNVRFFDDANNSVNVSHSSYFNYGLDAADLELNFSFSGSGSSYDMCIFPEDVSIISDFIITYNNFTYNAIGFNLTNNTQTLDLVVQSGTSAVTFTVKDFQDKAISDAIIKILKWDVGTNSYSLTETLRTDRNGQAVGQIVLEDVYYRFLVEVNGEVKLIDPESQGIKIYTLTRTFRISTEATEYFDNYNEAFNAETILSYNNNTGSFLYEFNNKNNAQIEGCLSVDVSNISGRFNLVENCTTVAAAEIVYSFVGINGSTYYATGYFKKNGEKFVTDILQKVFEGGYELYNAKGDEGKKEVLFFSFLLTMGLALMGIALPELSFIMMCVGLVFSAAIGLWEVSWQYIGGIVVLGFMYFLKKR